jgi:hypothetical protein
MCKATVLFNEVIAKYHPDISTNPEIRDFLASRLEWLNIEALIEETMAAVGGYKFVDGAHHDFSDGTECKTGSVAPNPSVSSENSYMVRITNIESCAGTTKGSIRAVVYNPHTQTCNYYYIPESDLNTVLKLTHGNGPGTIKNLYATWNKKTNKINKLDPYQVKNFQTLATMH